MHVSHNDYGISIWVFTKNTRDCFRAEVGIAPEGGCMHGVQ